MTIRYTERQNNTPEQVRDYIQGAADIVAELDIAPDLIPHAFVQAIALLASKQLEAEQVSMGVGLIDSNRH